MAPLGAYPNTTSAPVNAPNAFSQQLLTQLAHQQLLLNQPTPLNNPGRGPIPAALYGPSPILYYYPSPPMSPQNYFNTNGSTGRVVLDVFVI